MSKRNFWEIRVAKSSVSRVRLKGKSSKSGSNIGVQHLLWWIFLSISTGQRSSGNMNPLIVHQETWLKLHSCILLNTHVFLPPSTSWFNHGWWLKNAVYSMGSNQPFFALRSLRHFIRFNQPDACLILNIWFVF